jgi:hypothetical protein
MSGKDVTREFQATELKQLGLPGECKGGDVLEDRLIELVDEEFMPRHSKDAKEETNELRFVIFRLEDKSIWGVPYVRHENGRTSFDKTTEATRHVFRRLLVPANNK